MNEQVQKRRVERHCAAAMRAVAGHPGAEYRRQLLFQNGRGVNLYAPHLAADVLAHSLGRCRGVTDAMALRLVHTDFALHQSFLPNEHIGRLVFDTLEQMRVESLAPAGLKGVRQNLDISFNEWCRESLDEGMVENEVGLLVYSVIQVARSKLICELQDEEIEGIIESTRFKLAPIIGAQLSELKRHLHDQKAFAELALEIAHTISEMASLASGEMLDQNIVENRQRLMMPRQHDTDDRYVEGGAAGSGVTHSDGKNSYRYQVFCRDYDQLVSGESLCRVFKRNQLRKQLDRLVTAQAVSVSRLAQRLKALFAVVEKSGWNFGEEEGYLDGRRLAQLVANPSYSRVFKQQKHSPYCDTVVSFLIDNSGSMKRQRFEAVAVMVDIYSRALELAGIRSEILGFTTGGWSGGQSIKMWRSAGMPTDPGRLNDRLHIVYKDADTSWRRGRYSIASMLDTNHFREGLDGEALDWAASRLRSRNEGRKCLVMISDGAPMDSATSQYNDQQFLERHLKHVIHQLERDPEIELRAIGIALDMAEFFQQSIALDLTGTLGNQVFKALERLYGHCSA